MRKILFGLLLVGCAPHLYTPGDSGVDPGGNGWAAPENTWPSAAPPSDLVGVGFNDGQVSLDIRGTDQFGDQVSLWQFYGLTTLVDISTMWCAPCQELGMHAEALYQNYRDRGFMHLTVLHEDVSNAEVDETELNQWAGLPALGDGAYDVITAPVIEDFKGRSGSIEAIRSNQYPVVLLIGPDLKVIKRIEPPITEEAIEAELEAILGP